MDAWMWIVLAVVVVAVLAALAWMSATQRRRRTTLEGFGPEYERTVLRTGDRRAAEHELMDRAERRQQLDIRPLSNEARTEYVAHWQSIQAQFVDRPEAAIDEADRLLDRVMRDRGYPVDRMSDPAELVSVDHPTVIEDYRQARAIRERNDRRIASTDELRRALLRYRSLFDALLADSTPSTVPTDDEEHHR